MRTYSRAFGLWRRGRRRGLNTAPADLVDSDSDTNADADPDANTDTNADAHADPNADEF